MGNGEAKELACMTHGHELKGVMLVGGGTGCRGIKGRKKWNNYNSIINKMYLKIKKENVKRMRRSNRHRENINKKHI